MDMEMAKLRFMIFLPILAMFLILTSCSRQDAVPIRVTDIKTAAGVNDNFMPVNPMNVFPKETTKVFCWFSWKDAAKDVKLLAKWHYLTDDIPVLDYTFAIPRKEGTGSVSLSMPEGKTLPPGLYRVTLLLDKKELKSVTFKVL